MIKAPELQVSADVTLEAEALIREARARQKKRHRLMGAAVATTLIIGAGWYLIVESAGSSVRSTASGAGIHSVAAGAFTGTWHVHTFSITINADGRGTAQWPIDLRCGTGVGMGPPPCDTWIPGTVVGANGAPITTWNMVDGGHASIRLTTVNGTSASGIVMSSTDASHLGDGRVTFRISLSKDLLYVTGTWHGPHFILGPFCGPRAAASSVPQQQAEGINCGA
jgi:hypothetical protein